MGHRVLLIARTHQKVNSALENIMSSNPEALIEGFVCDMSLQKDIRNTAALILTRYSVIDGLINNVGTWMSNHSLTKEGIETVFATNHLSYVLMTHLLYPALKKAEHAR